MTNNVENLMLEHLKRFQATLDRVEQRLSDLTNRISNLGSGQAVLMQHLSYLAAADATQQVSVDNINERLNRIERRLELAS